MNINKRQFLIFSVLLIILFSICMLNKKLQNKIQNISIPEVKLKEIINKDKTMAVMISNDGSNYQEYNEDTWPGDNYKFKEAKCIDNNGSLVNEDLISFENDKVVLETNQTIYCTLYFDYKGTINILREKDINNALSDEIVGDMYRYQGLDKQYQNDDVNNPDNLPIVDNNYICFGTIDENECINNEDKYMYRIIGITTENQLKLIKETFIKEEDKNNFRWHSKREVSSPYTENGDCDGNKCEWPNTDIFKRLNGISGGNVKGSTGNSNIFIGSSEYDYMQENSDWNKIVESHDWLYGDIFSPNSLSYDGNVAYSIESGKELATKYWPELGSSTNIQESFYWTNTKSAKIGLMYMHDYLFAYNGGNPSNNENVKKTWLFYGNNIANTNTYFEWLMTRYSLASSTTHGLLAWAIYNSGNLSNGGITYDVNSSVRPVFYLVNNIQISGDGTKNRPFIIILN